MAESIQANSRVFVHFTLKLEDGSTAESTRNNGKPALFTLGDETLSPGMEDQLVGLKAGDKKAFSLAPESAFGIPSPDMIQYFSRREFIDAGEPVPGAIMLFTAMDGSEMPGLCVRLMVIPSPLTLTIHSPGKPFILISKYWKLTRYWRR